MTHSFDDIMSRFCPDLPMGKEYKPFEELIGQKVSIIWKDQSWDWKWFVFLDSRVVCGEAWILISGRTSPKGVESDRVSFWNRLQDVDLICLGD